jgi:hypothetical protein
MTAVSLGLEWQNCIATVPLCASRRERQPPEAQPGVLPQQRHARSCLGLCPCILRMIMDRLVLRTEPDLHPALVRCQLGITELQPQWAAQDHCGHHTIIGQPVSTYRVLRCRCFRSRL